jgi:hypothetical protein
MRNKFAYVAAVALMASGMLFGQSSDQNSQGAMDPQNGSSAAMAPQAGDNDAAQTQMQDTAQRGDANSDEQKPGAMATPMSSDEASPMGETPADPGSAATESEIPK